MTKTETAMGKKLLLINTGGTFSSVPSEKGLAPGINLEEIMKTIGPIGDGTPLS